MGKTNSKVKVTLSSDQLSKHKEYVTKVINTIDRLHQENPCSSLAIARTHMMYYNTYLIPGNPFLKKEVSNG